MAGEAPLRQRAPGPPTVNTARYRAGPTVGGIESAGRPGQRRFDDRSESGGESWFRLNITDQLAPRIRYVSHVVRAAVTTRRFDRRRKIDERTEPNSRRYSWAEERFYSRGGQGPAIIRNI